MCLLINNHCVNALKIALNEVNLPTVYEFNRTFVDSDRLYLMLL